MTEKKRRIDPVTPELREQVITRDMREAIRQGKDNPCVAGWISPGLGHCSGALTLDHVHHDYGMMGKRAPSDLDHLVTLCEWHHLWSGWATSHKAELRHYLREVNDPIS